MHLYIGPVFYPSHYKAITNAPHGDNGCCDSFGECSSEKVSRVVQMAITGNLQSVWAEYLHGAVFNSSVTKMISVQSSAFDPSVESK